MNQKLQSCFGFENKRNILWFKYSLTINSSELIIIIHLCICFKLAQISHFEVSQANKLKCMNFVFRHTIWANPKYLIHMSYCWRAFCFCRYSVRLTLSRGWTKAVWFFYRCLLKLNDETVARLSWIIQGKRDDITAIDESLSHCCKVKRWSKNNFPTWIMEMILPQRFNHSNKARVLGALKT